MVLKEMDESTEVSPEKDAMLEEMLKNVVLKHSSTTFKSQQIDDPEITDNDKRKIAETLLFNNPSGFLRKFGPNMEESDFEIINMFKTEQNGYDIDFQISQLRKMRDGVTRWKQVKNRRFEALKRLEEAGKYFSEDEMQKREPLLYHHLVGQYLTEKEKQAKFKEAHNQELPSFSKFLLDHAEEQSVEALLREQIAAEVADASSSDEEIIARPGTSKDPPDLPATKWGADWEDEEADKKKKENRWKNKKSKTKITIDERKILMDEFRTHLHTKFLDGLDADFDYSLVDNNPEYDCLQVRSQDEEEKYFDDETCDENICTDTGVEDY